MRDAKSEQIFYFLSKSYVRGTFPAGAKDASERLNLGGESKMSRGC